MHDGQTATGLEALDDLLLQTIDPSLASELEGMTDEDHTAWMQALRKQQTFRTRQVPRRVITVRRIDAKYIHSFMEAE